MGQVIEMGRHPHVCKPFMEAAWIKSPDLFNGMEPYEKVPPLGTIWRCDCGRLWEVRPFSQRGVIGNRKWRPASMGTSLRVWWRLRK